MEEREREVGKSSVGSDDRRYVHSVDPRDVGLGPVLLVLVLGVLEEDEAEAALQVDPVDGDGGGPVVGDGFGENFLHVAADDVVVEVPEEDGPDCGRLRWVPDA